MKWRMKISYIAFEKQKTIKELFLETIMKSYMSLFDQGRIPIRVEELFRQQDVVFENIIQLKFRECFSYLMSLNKIKDLNNHNEVIYID
jgi:hypothetical protein